MDNILKIAVMPLDIAWADRDENLYIMTSMAHRVPRNTDVIVLPELFSTGMVTDRAMLTGIADSDSHHPSLDAMRAVAAQCNAAVCGSVAWMTDGGTFVNRCLFVEPNGETTVYDKRHLFVLGNETEIFSAGTAPAIPVVRFRGWDIAMAICFDLRFPEWLRYGADKRYDLLLMPANWPQARAYAWRQLLIARAIENQAFVVGANRSGRSDHGCFDNQSYVFNYLGMPIAQPIPGARNDGKPDSILVATLSHSDLDDARRGFPVLP